MNALDGVIASNMALVPAASGGITAYASDSTDLILDLFGYFAPPSASFLTMSPEYVTAPPGGCGPLTTNPDCTYGSSLITYVPPAQMYGTSTTYTTGPDRTYFVNFANNSEVDQYGNPYAGCSNDSTSTGSNNATSRIPCNGTNFFLNISSSTVYTIIGRHRGQAVNVDSGIFYSYYTLGLAAADRTSGFANIPAGNFSNFQTASAPTVNSNDGVTVAYTGRTPSSVSIQASIPYTAQKGIHLVSFPTIDTYGNSAANQVFALLVYDATPAVSSVTPGSIPSNTLTSLTVTGSGFGDHPTIFVGGTAYNPGPPSRNSQGQDVVTFSVTLPSSYSNAQVPVQVQSNGAGGQSFFGAPQGSQQGSAYSNTFQLQLTPTVTLTPTSPSFLPVNSLNSWEQGTGCAGCYQKYTVTISPTAWSGTITFTLNSTAYVGDSTNRCFHADGSTDPTCTDPINSAPDYTLDPARQTLGIFQTPSSPTLPCGGCLWTQSVQTMSAQNSVDVWVTSLDYGGYGNVSATAGINGSVYNAVVTGSGPVYIAPIPIDANGDFIPDVWEQSLGVSVLDPTADAEPNPYAAPPGDGFTVFEEYRGFIVIRANGCAPGCTSHLRTNPISQQDVFVVDTSSLFESYSQILTNGTPFTYHSLSVDAADPQDTVALDPSRGVLQLNRSYTNNPKQTYALDVLAASLDALAGTNVLGFSGAPRNDGYPVRVDLTHIAASASSASFDAAVLTSQVLAHEVGHKFGLRHYSDIRPVLPPGAGTTETALIGNPASLPQQNYTQDVGQTQFYVWVQREGSKIQNQPAVDDSGNQVGDLSGMGTTSPTLSKILTVSDPTIGIGEYSTGSFTLPQPPSYISLWIQLFEIMDWTARLSPAMNSVEAWMFDRTKDLPYMCLKLSCP
ncbi:MAG: hypothetical protein JO307_09450 [Bryobacterales bacterium]|nr:hypothetical protein [Bryobacterales bacterium]